MRQRCLRVLSVLSLSLSIATGCQDDATKLKEHLARGEEHEKAGRIPEAQIEYRSALQIDPNHADAHYKLAHAYLRGRKVREGFWELRETVRLDAKNYPAKLEFAQLAILAGELEEALKQADLVVEGEPTNAAGPLMRGQALDALKRPDEALEAFRKAVEVQPKETAGMRALAHALGQRGVLDEAEQTWLQVLAADPSYENYTSYAGFLRRYFRKTRLDDGEAALTKAIEAANDEQKVAAYAQLANFFYTTGREDQSVATLKRGIEQSTDKVNLIYILARLERARGHTEEADALVEQATREKPDDPNVFLFLANYRAGNGDRVGALEAAEKAVSLDPGRADSQLRKAEIVVEMGYRGEREGGVEEGQKIVAEILQREPSNAAALFVDAKVKVTRNELVDAVTALKAALDARPDWAEAHYLLGATFAAQKQYSEARSELARALDLDPGLADANQVLAQVHDRLGEHEYAIEVGRRFLKQHPDDVKLHLLVAQNLVQLAKLDDALAELSAIPEDQRSPEIEYALGRIYLGKGQEKTAREHLLLANEQLPNQPDVLENLLELDRREKAEAASSKDAARIAKAQEGLEASLQRIQAAVEANPNDSRLIQLGGVVAVIENRLEDAEAAFRKAFELNPKDRSAVERLARFYAATNRTPQTIEVYEQAIQARPDDAQFHHYLGMLYELRGNSEQAIDRYESAIRIDPNLAEAKNNLAYILADKGTNLDRALDLAQDAKTLLPNNPSVSDTLGWVLFKRKVPGAAISYLKEAEAATSERDASLGQVRYHLAVAYEANGDKQEAVAAVDRSLSAFDSQAAALRKQGADPGPEPAWVGDARVLRDKLKAEPARQG
jgi:tetratricopeptide (TPR) repeat protein